MASRIYNAAKGYFAGAGNWGTTDFRLALLMSNTTADTENDGVVNLDDITTLDECDSAGYARQALAGEAVNIDDANDRAELDANDSAFAGLGGDATRDINGALLYVHVDGTAANDIAIAWIEFTSPIPSSANSISVPWDAEGILQLA